jgi:16S rRNA (uracil1498-N3)-methyltransferase
MESYKEKPVLKLICCCYEGEEKRVSIGEALRSFETHEPEPGKGWHYSEGKTIAGTPEIVILIGPEGDFSREEVALALECGFRPVHLGPSRLRTETAALTAVAAVYFHFCGEKGM